MHVSTVRDDEPRQGSYLSLIGLLLGLALVAGVLYLAGGPPHPPREVPGWGTIVATLKSSSLPLDAFAYILTSIAWLIWIWIVASLLLRLLVAGVNGLSHGAAWVHGLQAVSDRVTLPLVRRAVDSALVAVFVVNMVSRTVPGAAAAPLPKIATHPVAMQPHTGTHGHRAGHPEQHVSSDIEYTVQSGDNLWDIAQRFYGNGDEYPRLVAANVGRQMPDGQYFTQTGVIQPGWVLHIPLSPSDVQVHDGIRYYVVQEGDTLQGIAARLLGSEDRWTELFELNRDSARLDGDVLSNPNLIWPGLRLQVPSPHPQAPIHRAGPRAGGPTTPGRRSGRPLRVRPITPTPTQVPATRTPVPQPTTSPPTVLPTPAVHPTDTGTGIPVGLPVGEPDLIAGIAGAVAIAAGGTLLARRRVRRSLDEPPVPTSPPPRPIQEFADLESNYTRADHREGGESEQVALLTFQIYRFLARHGLHSMAILLAEYARGTAMLVLRGTREDQERLGELASELEQRLGGKVRISPTDDGDLALQIGATRLLELVAPVADRAALLPFVPLGMRCHDRILFDNWSEMGNVLIAAMPGGGSEIVLTSLLAALVARQGPEQLRLWTIADHRTVGSQIRQLPHQHILVDPSEEGALRSALEQLRAELRRRMRDSEKARESATLSTAEPEILLVVGELDDLSDEDGSLELLVDQGPAYGIRVLAVTSRGESLDEATIAYFRTRLVLQQFDDDESDRVLGGPEAADLGSGEFLLRISQRQPIRLRGFRVAEASLHELVAAVHVQREAGSVGSTNEHDRDEVENATLEPEEAEQGVTATPETLRVPDVEEAPGDSDPCVECTSAAMEHVPAISSGPAELDTGKRPGSDREVLAKVDESAPGDLLNGHGQHDARTETLSASTSDVEAGTMASGGTDVEPVVAPLIQIQCFGDFVVKSGEQEISPSGEEGASYKAWELLAFLAAQPEGAVSKERLLAAVWPDVGGERVTNRVHAALVRLRALLSRQVPGVPSDVVRLDRDGTCRLDTTRIASDVHEFVSLLHVARSARPEEAIAALERVRQLYKGDLLSSRGAREYEWVVDRDETGVTLREHYREECKRATKRLARLYREVGRADVAVPLLKSLLQAEPALEDVVRDLYQCYRDLGDLSSLIREDRHLRQALREAYHSANLGEVEEIPPEPVTVDLFRQIRQDLEARTTGSIGRV